MVQSAIAAACCEPVRVSAGARMRVPACGGGCPGAAAVLVNVLTCWALTIRLVVAADVECLAGVVAGFGEVDQQGGGVGPG